MISIPIVTSPSSCNQLFQYRNTFGLLKIAPLSALFVIFSTSSPYESGTRVTGCGAKEASRAQFWNLKACGLASVVAQGCNLDTMSFSEEVEKGMLGTSMWKGGKFIAFWKHWLWMLERCRTRVRWHEAMPSPDLLTDQKRYILTNCNAVIAWFPYRPMQKTPESWIGFRNLAKGNGNSSQ